LHPDHNRSVGDAFRGASDLDVVTPAAGEVTAELAESEVLVTYRWDDSYLTGSLRWVQSISVGVDQYPIEMLRRAGVVLTSARGCHGPQVSEHAFGLLLALTRGIGRSMRNAEAKVWKPIPGVEISGMTLGILGLGTIGEAIAQKAVAWGMDVIGTKSSIDGYEGAARAVFSPEDTVSVFEVSDAVISVLPDTESTRGIVTAECLSAMDGGWFVNVGRGTAVKAEDLLDALASGALAGVGLDVFDPEPLPEPSPLWSHPRVVITNHTAGLSPRYGPRLLEIFRRNLDALEGSGAWVNRVE
jgi:phosphoglycerate dehydrogenase-like enzyme